MHLLRVLGLPTEKVKQKSEYFFLLLMVLVLIPYFDKVLPKMKAVGHTTFDS